MQVSATFTGHRGPVYAVIHGMAPNSFISGSGDGLVVLWDLMDPDAGEVLVNVGQAVFSLCLLEEPALLLIGTEGGGLHVVDLRNKRELQLLDVHRRGVFSIVPLPNGRVACAGGDGSLSIWRVNNDRNLELLRQIPMIEEKLRKLATSHNGEKLALACGDGSVRVLDSELFNEQYTLQAHPRTIAPGTDTGSIGSTAVAYHPTKPVLFSGGKDGHLRLWRADADHALLHELPLHKGGIYALAFSPDGRWLATASRDKSAKVWDAHTLDPVARLDRAAGGHTHSVNALLWLDLVLLTASDDRRMLAWTPRP